MSRLICIGALAAGLTVLGFPGTAGALTVRDGVEREVTFSSDVCERVTETITLPRNARAVRPTAPEVGDQIDGLDGPVAAISEVDVVKRSGRAQIRVIATPDPAACVDPGTGEATGWEDDGDGVTIEATFRRTVKVYVQGTGRGDTPAIRPRDLPFGARSAVVGLRWSRWGGRTATGSGSVEFNPCIPSCAEGRAEYYPARVRLSRPRSCGGQYRYTRFSFRYVGRRPSGFPASYREFFGC